MRQTFREMSSFSLATPGVHMQYCGIPVSFYINSLYIAYTRKSPNGFFFVVVFFGQTPPHFLVNMFNC